MEFLIGRSLANNVANLDAGHAPRADRLQEAPRLDRASSSRSPTPGWATAGWSSGRVLPRLDGDAASFPPWATGSATSTGSSASRCENGWQQERPDNWLRRQDPWEVARPNEQVEIRLGCSFEMRDGRLHPVPGSPSTLLGIPFDRPVVGYGGQNINTLRLWAAAAPDYFDFERFSRGEFVEALDGQDRRGIAHACALPR